MELFDAPTVVIPAVLLVHITGVIIVAASAAGLAISLFTVVMAVHLTRTTWGLTQNWRNKEPFLGSSNKVRSTLKAGAVAARPLLVAAGQKISQLRSHKPQ
ncbi:hypothetical protein ABIA52_003322 [Paenarthrobacter histidinolovorans]|uniref:Uncharacterized protein n=1 Tax=Paenarthrobacter histidinolovorans TaxID=43664 RepID=A0ABW8NA68_9MICC